MDVIRDLAQEMKGYESEMGFTPASRSRVQIAHNLCAFIERLPHVKGSLAGALQTLRPNDQPRKAKPLQDASKVWPTWGSHVPSQV